MKGMKVKSFILGACVLGCVIGFAAVVRAEEEMIKLCDALADEKTYEDNEDFRFMVAGKDGWVYRSDFDLKQDDYEFSQWSLNSFYRVKDAFKKNGAELAVALIPTRGIVGYPYLLPPQSETYSHAKAKAGYIGMVNAFKNVRIITADTQDVDTVSGFFLKRDNHWTAIGAKYMAQKMADAIKASPVYTTLKKTEFETKEETLVEPKNANDNFLEFIEEKCGKMPPVEKISVVYTTTPKVTGDAEAALLGDQEKPEAVLLGTSNSTEPEPTYANFIGFLREYTGVDIKNDSVQGGSIRGAIGNYVLMGDYQKEKPKLIIWELSAHYGFEQKTFFREIIPAIYGACSDANAIAISSGDLGKSETEIFKNLQDKKLFSYNYYLVLELENKDIRKLSLDFIHITKKDEEMKFDRSVRNFPTNNGIYFAELRYGIDEPLKSININTKEGSGKYKARICKVPV